MTRCGPGLTLAPNPKKLRAALRGFTHALPVIRSEVYFFAAVSVPRSIAAVATAE